MEPDMTEPLPEALDAASIERIAHGLLDLNLPYAEWGHTAHFAAALWLLRNSDVLAANGGMEPILRRYNKAVGIPDIPTRGYHDTITKASMHAAAFVLRRHAPDAPLGAVLADLLAAEFGDPDWLLSYWSRDLLMSNNLRRKWSDPDLAAFRYLSDEKH
jgi:hypothetical protein